VLMYLVDEFVGGLDFRIQFECEIILTERGVGQER